MASTFEVWLCDDFGRRKYLFEKFSSLSYSRTSHGYGTCQLIMPYDKFQKDVGFFPKPDMRIDIWRSPATGIPARRESSFLIRKINLYQRTTDNLRMLEIFGRSPLDLLHRQVWKTNATITDSIDDIMKTIVRGRFVMNLTAYSTVPMTVQGGVYTSTGEFAVDEDAGDGPSITAPASMYLRNVLDILQDLKATSFTLNDTLSTNKRILFDVIEDDSLSSVGFGYRFRTYPILRGRDRTGQLTFSVENGNIAAPVYYEDYLDEITSVFIYNDSQTWASQNEQSNDQYLSRWNYIEDAQTTSEATAAGALTNVRSVLRDKKAKKVFNADFLNSPGDRNHPRSLYGVDWDMGDLLTVKFGNMVMQSEVAIVYVALDENGQETITGKSTVGAA